MAAEHPHPVEVGTGPEPGEDLLGEIPRAGHEAIEQGHRAGAGGRQVVEHRDHAGDARRARLGGDEGRPDRLGGHHQVPVPVGDDGRVVAVAAERRRHRRQIALATKAGVVVHQAGESR